ncbi:MAG: ATP-dependent DNA helicase RecG [Chloroflexaceae bacterium]
MQERDQIINLGKVLAEEERRGCDNSAVDGGLQAFLTAWQSNSNGALEVPAVRAALDLLAAYDDQPVSARQEQLTQALAGLRALFKTAEPSNSAKAAAPRQPRQPARSNQPTPASGPLRPDSPIANVPGIGRTTVNAFKRLKLHTVADLLYHFPHRYDDYTSQKCIADLTIGSIETVVCQVCDVRTFRTKTGRDGVEVQVRDESGLLKVVFFGARWLAQQFTIGRKVVLSGKVTSYQGLRQMTSPDWEPFNADQLIHTGRLVPVHPLTKGLYERNARRIIKQVVDLAAPQVHDYLPAAVQERANLLPLPEALAQMHFPDSPELLERARHRLGFDEFLFIQLGVIQRRILWQGELGYAVNVDEAVHADLLAKLPFALTGAQQRTLAEIFADMHRPVPMARLLQGDVGSGKTIVAAAALLQAVAAGLQGALMAPTEILAEQHYKGLRQLLGQIRVPRKPTDSEGQPLDDWKSEADAEQLARLEELKRLLNMVPEDDLGGEGVRVALLTGSLGVKDRRRVLEAIANGEVDLVIGTHALITEGVQYQSLGLVVIDEQHRFGVEQRERLKQKGLNPHMLVMTATPIPRTLTLTIYGDLDTSVLDELPPGRQEIKTRWITRGEREKAYRHMRKEIGKGRQAFVICPLVEESEKIDLPSAEETYVQLQNEVFPDLRVGLIHGRMLPREKDLAMRAFRDHEFDILVATAVVEVGIDVPNATTIMIDGAERFGLAQLHQFRGRVGRGEHQSYCILVSDIDNEVTQQRLEAMEGTHDGFKLAEIDLQLRGPGEFLGKRQSGMPDLKVARLADTRLLHAANREAQQILAEDPQLERAEHAPLRAKVQDFWEKAEGSS